MQLTAKILALYLLLGSFLPRTDFSQLQKLPNLYQHYQLHQQEALLTGKTVSIKDFLLVHFVSPDGHEHDDSGNSHNSLPFHSTSSSFQFLLQDFSLPNFQHANSTLSLLTSTERFVSSGIIAALFRPPIL